MRRTSCSVSIASSILVAIATLGPAPAQAGTWSFTVQGLEPDPLESTLPVDHFSGVFSGEDSNGDGLITTPELSDLWIDYDFNHITIVPISMITVQDVPTPNSGVSNFSFGNGGPLSFSAFWFGDGTHENFDVTMGQTIGFSAFAFGERSNWTPDTMVTVTPVPEPASAALLLAGLGALAAWRGRRHGSGFLAAPLQPHAPV